MPNPYDDILSDEPEERPKPPPERPAEQPEPAPAAEPTPIDLNDPRFMHEGPETLDLILESIETFNAKAEAFSRLLSEMSVADHKVEGKVARLFLVTNDNHDRGNLAGERAYHELQARKFGLIIEPMRALADLHLATVRQFNDNIDKEYYSLEKTDRAVAEDKARAIDGINLQRRILADATDALQILRDGLKDTERRLKKYINAGGDNNISTSEFGLLVRKREELTSGRQHKFDYDFFDVNLLDKTAISLGIYLKETSGQYLRTLSEVMGL